MGKFRRFSSPVGDFVFYIGKSWLLSISNTRWFSSPYGAFVFYIPEELTVSGWLDLVFVPIRGFCFLYPVLGR